MTDNDSQLPSKKPNRGQKKIDSPKNKVPFASEIDLWNFEENQDSIIFESTRTPWQNASNEPKLTIIEEESVAEIPFAEATKPQLTPIANPMIQSGDLDKFKELAELNEKHIAANIIKKNTEAEIWEDIFDDDPHGEIVIPDKPKVREIAQIRSNIVAALEKQAPPRESERADVVTKPAQPIEIDEFAPLPPTGKSTPIQITKFSRLEKITSLAFLALFLIGGFFAYKGFHDNVKAEVNPYATPNFPIQGKIAKIANAKTYWRLPILEGPNPDPIKLNVILIPVIEITLDDDDDRKGAIRVIFRNGEKVIIGDSLTKTFADRKFTANQSATFAFPCTDGFTDYGEQEAYRAQLSKPWSIEVYEGTDDNAPIASFNLLFSTPVSILRQ